MDVDQTTVLALHVRTSYATASGPAGPHDRVAEIRAYELIAPPKLPSQTLGRAWGAGRQVRTARRVVATFDALGSADVKLIGHTVNHYDGPAYAGLPAGQVGVAGLLTRAEALAFTDAILDQAYGARARRRSAAAIRYRLGRPQARSTASLPS